MIKLCVLNHNKKKWGGIKVKGTRWEMSRGEIPFAPLTSSAPRPTPTWNLKSCPWGCHCWFQSFSGQTEILSSVSIPLGPSAFGNIFEDLLPVDGTQEGSLGCTLGVAGGHVPGRVARRADPDCLQHPARSELLHCSLRVKATKQWDKQWMAAWQRAGTGEQERPPLPAPSYRAHHVPLSTRSGETQSERDADGQAWAISASQQCAHPYPHLGYPSSLPIWILSILQDSF